MSWSLNASGHTENAENEARFLDVLRAAVQSEDAGAYSASISTQHHGVVNLMDASPKEPEHASPNPE